MTVPLERHYVVELHASEERVSEIRRSVAAVLRYWKLEPQIGPVCKGVDELLANVRRHVGDDNRCVVELRWAGRHLTVSVEDDGPRMPRLLTAGGRGLGRVAALSDSWGTCPTAEGKVIWFTRSVRTPQNVPRTPWVPLTGIDAAQRSPVPAPAPVPVLTAAVPTTVPAVLQARAPAYVPAFA
ncbi:ATP-binding protein [Streptomyces sp. NPDC088400]|uniref:ATP-binding protein n=1 Tax=Streptomyces sp. NPDC088400 TaxID=3365861 RepID=UPI0037F3B4D8